MSNRLTAAIGRIEKSNDPVPPSREKINQAAEAARLLNKSFRGVLLVGEVLAEIADLGAHLEAADKATSAAKANRQEHERLRDAAREAAEEAQRKLAAVRAEVMAAELKLENFNNELAAIRRKIEGA